MTVHFHIEKGICLVTLHNPPVNVIGQTVRQGLNDAMDAAIAASVEKVTRIEAHPA